MSESLQIHCANVLPRRAFTGAAMHSMDSKISLKSALKASQKQPDFLSFSEGFGRNSLIYGHYV